MVGRKRALEHGVSGTGGCHDPPNRAVSDEALAHLSSLKWEHINLTGDFHWRKDAGLRNRKSRPLRTSKPGIIP
jgi:hypothetical protein